MNDLAFAVDVYCRLQSLGVTYIRRGDMIPEHPEICPIDIILPSDANPVLASHHTPASWVPGNYRHRRGKR